MLTNSSLLSSSSLLPSVPIVATNLRNRFRPTSSPVLCRDIKINFYRRLFSTKDRMTDSKLLSMPLDKVDPEILKLIKEEGDRQDRCLSLIASENFIPLAVCEALGSCLSNKYSEGTVGHRYYGGNEVIDKIEALCQNRALQAFDLDSEYWGVNVQPLSGSPANFEVFHGLLPPNGRIMYLDLPHGGHLSHGYTIPSKQKLTASGTYFQSMPYFVNLSTGLIDYDELHAHAKAFKPKIIVAGISAYPKLLDYKRFREICDDVGAYLVSDIAHVAGLMAAKVIPSAFDYSDVVTTTTHKTLRGPRGAMIFYRRGVQKINKKTGEKIMYDIERPINDSVFPGCQGGPHNHTTGALAVALSMVKTEEFRKYQQAVLNNAKALADELQKQGFQVCTGGTECHLLIVDLSDKKIDTEEFTKFMDYVNISANKNTVPGDKSALRPSGIRLGSPSMTTRGFDEDDFRQVAKFFKQAVDIFQRLYQAGKTSTIISLSENDDEAKKLRDSIENFARKFPSGAFLPKLA